MDRKIMTETYLADGKLVVSDADGVLRLRFNNPARRNAMTFAMWEALGDVTERVAGQTRAVVLEGSGEHAFVSGADISEFATLRSTPAQIAQYNATVARALSGLAGLAMPVVAKIQGYCIGSILHPTYFSINQ